MTDLFRSSAPVLHRMKLLLAVAVGLVFLCVAPCDHAQQPDSVSSSPPLGSVIVHVYDAATGLPIRSAEVRLEPKPDANVDPPGVSGASDAAQPAVQKRPRIATVRGSSDLNGDANLAGVPAGEYFVSAIQVAYLTPADLSILNASADQVNAVVAALPSIRIGPGAAVSVSIPLHRGAVISGRIQYADGSPAIGLPVAAEYEDGTPLLRTSPNQQLLLSLSIPDSRRDESTDDQGRYRILALRPGKYIVTTRFTLPHSSANVVMDNGTSLPGRRERWAPQIVPVFYPESFRRDNAKRIKITADEEITNTDITIDTSGLHTLRGKVLTGDDRRPPGQAVLFLRESERKEPIRFIDTEEDGTFQVPNLPSGSYSLVASIIAANDQEPRPSDNPAAPPQPKLYKPFAINFTITDRDLTLDDILVTPLKPGEPLQLPF